MFRFAFAAAAAALILQACASRPQRYPGTDVMEVPGFKLRTATDVQQSSGTIQSGTLVYSGKADLHDAFRGYVESMQAQGWTTTSSNFTSDKATATLRKDNRVCHLDFTAVEEKRIQATIRVSRAEPQAD